MQLSPLLIASPVSHAPLSSISSHLFHTVLFPFRVEQQISVSSSPFFSLFLRNSLPRVNFLSLLVALRGRLSFAKVAVKPWTGPLRVEGGGRSLSRFCLPLKRAGRTQPVGSCCDGVACSYAGSGVERKLNGNEGECVTRTKSRSRQLRTAGPVSTPNGTRHFTVKIPDDCVI